VGGVTGQDARTDAELLTSSAGGDEAAFTAFVARHRASVHRFASLLLHDAQRAEDVLQDTFVQAWRHAGAARVQGGARAWLLAIARNSAARTWRATAASPTVSLTVLGAEAGFADPAATPAAFAQLVESRAMVHEALAALSPGDREVLVLRELEQRSGDEVAAVLGLSLEAMKSRLHRARLRLVAELRRRLPSGGEA
jgi:RNA polymerase sigma-70 factor, ECF subfamily